MMKQEKGFTLVEMIIAIVLMGIIGIGVAYIMPYPIKAYLEGVARAELSEQAGSFLVPFSREIQNALPNSPRIKLENNRLSLEFIPVIAVGRYRSSGPGTADDILDFSQDDTAFNILADPDNFLPSDAPGIYRIVIDNVGQYAYSSGQINYDAPLGGLNAYDPTGYIGSGLLLPNGSRVITDTGVAFSSVPSPGGAGNEVRVILPVAQRFSLQSPQKRVYVVNTGVSYICDLNSQTLTKYYDYYPTNVQNTNPSNIGAQNSLVLKNVSACRFQYDPGTATRSGTITVEITLTGEQDNQATFFQQVQVKNAA